MHKYLCIHLFEHSVFKSNTNTFNNPRIDQGYFTTYWYMYLLIQEHSSLYLYMNSIEPEEFDTYRHDAFWARSTMDMLVR